MCAASMWKNYAHGPSVADMPPMTTEDNKLLQRGAVSMFQDPIYGVDGENGKVDLSAVSDGKDEFSNTGQKRRILWMSAMQRRVEACPATGPKAGRNMLELPAAFWADHPELERLIKRIRDHFLKQQPGGACLEMEAMFTPPEAGPQEPHQDTRFNMTNYFVMTGPNGSRLGTRVAVADTDLSTGDTDDIVYTQLPVAAGRDGFVTQVNPAQTMNQRMPHTITNGRHI
jgi:hypothetical protein